jgi:hypothetical protein
MPRVSEFEALRNMQRVYEQYDIKVEFASGESLALSPDEELKLNIVDGDCEWDQLSDEQKLLHGMGSVQAVGATDIVVYFVNTIKEVDGSLLNGCAGHLPSRAAVVVAASGSKWTMAHEVGHVLLTSTFSPVHHASAQNLMFRSTAKITASLPNLDDKQLTQMRLSPYCVSY